MTMITTNSPSYYKQLLESLLETDATPAWVRGIIATEHGPVAVFNNLNYPIMLEDDEIIHVRRVELDAANGIIRVYISRRDAELVVHDQNPKEYDTEFKTFFEKLFAPYELDEVHRSRHHDFIRYDALEAYMTYGCYYLGGQVESAWFEYLHSMDYEAQLSAVKSDPNYIRYIDDPDVTMQMAAVNSDPYTIQYIVNPTDAVQMAAIKAIPAVLTYIENPTILSQSSVKHYIVKYLLERLKINAIYHVTGMVNYLRKHGVAWPQLDVIEQGLAPDKLNETMKLSDLNTASEKRQITAVRKNGERIEYISNPSLAVQLAAVQSDGRSIRWIKNPSEAVQIAAVHQFGPALASILHKGIIPSEAVQLAALQTYGGAIYWIKNPSPELFADTQAKQSIIKYILLLMKQNDLVPAANVVKKLRKHNVSWPQLDVIEQGLASDKLDESYYGRRGKLPDINSVSEKQQITRVKANLVVFTYIENPGEAVQLAAVRKNGSYIKYIDNPSEAVQLAAVQHKGQALRDILHKGIIPSEAVQLAAVQKDHHAIYDFSHYGIIPNETIQLAAVQQDGRRLGNIKNPSLAVQLAAVRTTGDAIKYIDNPSYELILAAITNDGRAIRKIKNVDSALFNDKKVKNILIKTILRYMKLDNHNLSAIALYKYLRKHKVQWPELDVIDPALKTDNLTEAAKYDINAASEAAQIAAVKKDVLAIYDIANPSEAVQMAAVRKDGEAIRYITGKGIKPSEAVQIAAVKNDGMMIKYILYSGIKPSKAVQMTAVENEGDALYWLEKFKIDRIAAVYIAAIEQFPYAIQFVDYPSTTMQLTALNQTGAVIRCIKNPNPSLFTNPEIKKIIIKSLLDELQGSYSDTVHETLVYLRNHNVSWPQLDVIEQALDDNKSGTPSND